MLNTSRSASSVFEVKKFCPVSILLRDFCVISSFSASSSCDILQFLRSSAIRLPNFSLIILTSFIFYKQFKFFKSNFKEFLY